MAVTLIRKNNFGYDGSGDETLILGAQVNHITITASIVGLLLSVDKGQTFISIPSGTHSFRVGWTDEIRIQSEQDWEFIAEQA